MSRSSVGRVSCMALVCAAVALLLLLAAPSADGAKFLKRSKPIPLPHGRHHRFPTHEELAARPELREQYAGDNKLTIHVVPHTHDDVGWLKTVDQYYLGANNSIQHASVHYVLSTVIEELQKNPARKFIYVEQAFFQLWYVRQSAEVQAATKKLVATGQLEFINGGWCMHDEAATHWIDMVDQTTLGHQFILKEFGVTPKIGWQIDPFGHSATQAALLSAKVGFEGLFFGRIDHQDHDQRMAAKNMEFLWRASPSLGPKAQIFTGAFQNGNYGPPNTFCWDFFCGDAPIITDKSFIDYNVPTRVQQFLDQINNQASFTKGQNIMITMGSDFEYEHAREWYDQLDILIDAVTADGRVNIQYSTPSLYVEAKNKEQLDFTVKTDDFFPYADGDHMYWTGYFVSRPALKRYVRTSSALLQTARQMELFSGGDGSAALPLEKAVGVVQHHDAVAGTAKQHVAYDYAQRLHIAQTEAQTMMSSALSYMVSGQNASAPQIPFVFCELANISVCAASVEAKGPFQITLWNSLARARTELVTVPVANANLVVLDQSGGKAIQAQVLQVFNVSSHTTQSAQLSLNFLATVPGLGFRTFFVQPSARAEQVFHEEKHARSTLRVRMNAIRRASTWVSAAVPAGPHSDAGGVDVILQNEMTLVSISGTTGLPTQITDKVSGASTPFGITYGWYDSYQGDGQKSGAYIFRPSSAQRLNRITVMPRLLVQNGPVVNQVTFLVNDFLNHTLRLVVGAHDPAVALEYSVGEIPIEDNTGKEIVLQYSTGLASNAMWWADSNAREMLPRVRNQRFSFNLSLPLDEPISNNYVPMNSAAYISDGLHSFTVLNERSQGVSSQADGELEIMIHRRTLQDDGRGVGEPLNETESITSYYSDPQAQRIGTGLVITGTHYLFFGNASSAASVWRPATQRVYAPFTPFYAPLPAGQSPAQYAASHVVEGSYVKRDLPVNVEVISMSAWDQWLPKQGNQATMLRLAHMFGVGEDAALSQPVAVDLSTLFSDTPTGVAPMSLTLTKPAAEAEQRMQWNAVGDNAQANLGEHLKDAQLQDFTATLNPLDVQTFLLTFG